MDFAAIWEEVFHLDRHLDTLIRDYGSWTYAILGAVVFAETGLVVMPFLPGDSLLFAAGMMAARGALRLPVLVVTLAAASIAGDSVNYWFGRSLGARFVRRGWVRAEHMARTQAYFRRYGPMTVVLARFVPIVRTFAPFVAGIGHMDYRRFLAYSVAGGLLWVGGCSIAGYALGNIPVIRDNFEYAVLTIIALTSLAPVVGWARRRFGPPEADSP